MTIHVYHQLRQPSGENYCSNLSTKKATCSHFCFPSPRPWDHARVTCACPTTMKLASDGHSCVPELHYKNSFETNSTTIKINDHLVPLTSFTILLILGLAFALILVISIVVSSISDFFLEIFLTSIYFVDLLLRGT